MERDSRKSWVKLLALPAIVVATVAFIVIAFFEHRNGILPAISACREGEEKCQKYGLIAAAEDLNREYNDLSKIEAGDQLRSALDTYFKSTKANERVNVKLDPGKDLQTALKASEQPLENFWQAAAPLRNLPVITIPRDFRQGYEMWFPEYNAFRRVAIHSLNSALHTPNEARRIESLKDVAWLRERLCDNYESDLPFMIAREILRQEMDVTRALITRRPSDSALRDHARELLKSEPVPHGIEFRLKADHCSMLQALEPDYPLEKVMTDMGIRTDEPLFANYKKWRRYPRSKTAWKSVAYDVISFGYEELHRNPPKTYQEWTNYRKTVDWRQMRFGEMAATGWTMFHQMGYEDVQPFKDAKSSLLKTLAKHP